MFNKNDKISNIFHLNNVIQKIMYKDEIVYTSYYTYTLSGVPPLKFWSIGKPLLEYEIDGKTYQDSTPSPTSPVPVNGVGVKTENLLDTEYFSNANINASGVITQTAISADFCIYFAKVTPNKKYTISSSKSTTFVIGYFTNKPSVGSKTYDDKRVVPSGGYSITITVPNDNAINYIAIRFNAGQTAMLNEGSTALPFEPYGYKIPILTSGKNLADVPPFTATWATRNSKVLSVINALDIGTYTISVSYQLTERNDISDASVSRIGFIGSKTTMVVFPWGDSQVGTKKKITMQFIVTEKGEFSNAYFYGCGINGIGATGKAEVTDIQIELGTTATPYEPYKEPIETTIYTDKPLYSGEVLRSDGSREVKWAEYVCTGNETWSMIDQGSSGSQYFYIARLYFTGKPWKPSGAVNCNYAINRITTGVTMGNSYGFLCWFAKDIVDKMAISEWTEWVKSKYESGNPLTFIYELDEPTTEPITLPEIPTLSGTTILDVNYPIQDNIYTTSDGTTYATADGTEYGFSSPTIPKPENMTVKYYGKK